MSEICVVCCAYLIHRDEKKTLKYFLGNFSVVKYDVINARLSVDCGFFARGGMHGFDYHLLSVKKITVIPLSSDRTYEIQHK